MPAELGERARVRLQRVEAVAAAADQVQAQTADAAGVQAAEGGKIGVGGGRYDPAHRHPRGSERGEERRVSPP